MAKVHFIQVEGVNDITTAIRTMKPGDEVAYSTSEDYAGYGIGLRGKNEQRIARDAAIQAESEGRGMRFHRKVGKCYNHVIRCVAPGTKRRLEEIAAAVTVPMRASHRQRA